MKLVAAFFFFSPNILKITDCLLENSDCTMTKSEIALEQTCKYGSL